MSDLDLRGLILAAVPQGPDAGADASLVTTALVYAVDAPGRRVQVSIQGTALWLPAVAGRYKISATAQGLARVLLNATTGRPALVLGPVDPQDTAVLGTVTATGTGTATVTVLGSSYALPAAVATYTVGQTAWVLLSDWGIPLLVVAPSVLPATTSSTPTPPTAPTSETAAAVIGPQWSGTYRVGSGWDRWNTNRYGGRSDVYQGNAYGSGQLIGMAAYGDQVANLGATTINSISIQVYRQSDSYVNSLTVQGSASGAQPAGAPSSSGTSTASNAVAGGQWATIALPSDVREAFRTGAVKSLVVVGSAYGGWGGAGTGGSMVMSIGYTRPA